MKKHVSDQEIKANQALQHISDEGEYKRCAINFILTVMASNPDRGLSEKEIQYLLHIFGIKVEFFNIVHCRGVTTQKLSKDEIALEVSKPEWNSFKKDVSDNRFDEFMHFCSVFIPVFCDRNKIDINDEQEITNVLTGLWVQSGRSLEEKSAVGCTPLNLAVCKQNIFFILKLHEYEVDITQIDSFGFSELHKLVGYISKAREDLEEVKKFATLEDDQLKNNAVTACNKKIYRYENALKKWVDLGVSIDMKATANEYEGLTAAAVAVIRKMPDIAAIILQCEVESVIDHVINEIQENAAIQKLKEKELYEMAKKVVQQQLQQVKIGVVDSEEGQRISDENPISSDKTQVGSEMESENEGNQLTGEQQEWHSQT